MARDSLGREIGNGNRGTMSDMFKESPQEQEQNSEEVFTPDSKGSTGGVTAGSLKAHKFPSNIDQPARNDKENPSICEIIHFTVYKKGGFSFNRESESSAMKARAESVAVNKEESSILSEPVRNGPGAKKVAGKQIEEEEGAFQNRLNTWKEKRVVQKTKVQEGFLNTMKEAAKNTRTNKQTIEHCFLYMPAAVTYSEGANWASEDLGAMGNLISGAIKGSSGSLTNMLTNFGAGGAAELAMGAGTLLGAKLGGVAGAIGGALLMEGAGKGIKSGARIAQNPYSEQLFNGVDFRSFSFEFVFTATNEDEYSQVRNIIQMFRLHSRPGFAFAEQDALYTFPNEFGIVFRKMQNGKYVENNHLPKLHDCVCTKVDTNFAPGGQWLAHNDGEPISISLSLGFTETQKNTQKDIGAGY